ncbi:MAG: WhiB family transcriptional regulator [Dermatophilaceae bacterium]
MQLAQLLDHGARATVLDGEIPCQSNEPDLWFADTPDGVEFAKALCVSCPMMDACLAGALARGEAAGVWGGQYFVDGVVVARKRPRGRPRKDAVAA